MSEAFATLPLDRKAMIAGSVQLSVRRGAGALNLRGKGEPFFSAVIGALGVRLPVTPNTVCLGDPLRILWLGPDEWLLLAPIGRISELRRQLELALQGVHYALTEVTDQWVILQVAGARTREVLAFGCPLDLHRDVFRPESVAQTLFLKVAVVITRHDPTCAFELMVQRSSAEYLWSVLEQSISML